MVLHSSYHRLRPGLREHRKVLQHRNLVKISKAQAAVLSVVRALVGDRKAIDVHHHIVPDFYAAIVERNGGDPSGFPTPKWSESSMVETMERLRISKAYVSVTAPGPKIVQGQASTALARDINTYSMQLQARHKGRVGVFASLPDFQHVDAVLEEIHYCTTTIKADGFTVFTSYGDARNGQGPDYLGSDKYDPIWETLNALESIVFIHPCHAPCPLINPYAPQPGIDYVHETTKAASDLVLRGKKGKYPKIRFILSHGGGTLPLIAHRIAAVGAFVNCPLSAEDIMKDYKTFYYDTALTTTDIGLYSLLNFADHDHILFGSDVPYCPIDGADLVTTSREAILLLKMLQPSTINKINHHNANRLFGL